MGLKATYETKAAQYEGNQKVRQDEIEALQKAIEIMSGGDVSGAYKEHVNLAQKPASLLQMGLSVRRTLNRQRATEMLRSRARVLRSTTLMALVAQMKVNPFAKIIDMVEKLIDKLKEEAAQEADHKAWCDEELRANKQRRSKKESDVARLTAEIEEKDVAIANMVKEIETLSAEQADLAAAMKEAT